MTSGPSCSQCHVVIGKAWMNTLRTPHYTEAKKLGDLVGQEAA